MLKTLIIATVLLPALAFAQQQPPQPRRPGEWCPVGWSASGNYCVPASDKAPSRPQKRMVPGGLARERQLLHPVKRRVDYKPSILDSQRNCPTIRRRTGDFA
jgi:hypothetical protein